MGAAKDDGGGVPKKRPASGLLTSRVFATSLRLTVRPPWHTSRVTRHANFMYGCRSVDMSTSGPEYFLRYAMLRSWLMSTICGYPYAAEQDGPPAAAPPKGRGGHDLRDPLSNRCGRAMATVPHEVLPAGDRRTLNTQASRDRQRPASRRLRSDRHGMEGHVWVDAGGFNVNDYPVDPKLTEVARFV